MADSQTPVTPGTGSESRNYWAGFRAGIARAWANRSALSFKWIVLLVVVLALVAFRDPIGRFISNLGAQQQTQTTQAGVGGNTDTDSRNTGTTDNSSTSTVPDWQIVSLVGWNEGHTATGCVDYSNNTYAVGYTQAGSEPGSVLRCTSSGWELRMPDGSVMSNGTTVNNADTTANVSVASADTSSSAAPVTLQCPGGWEIEVPENGQLFMATVWRNDVAHESQAYAVIYDPDQSGSMDLPAKGWWYQGCLPGENREAHEVALTVVPGEYRFIGPECVVYHNYDGEHPFDQGRVLANRQNIQHLTIPASVGAENESWLFVRCNAGDASGFSLALREPATSR